MLTVEESVEALIDLAWRIYPALAVMAMGIAG